ncbi:Piso0_003661 [Millerozyma farinosa CBS 7064]|uniref:Piso0_003661 protein n=1 Tax=Pichia sorbitophila (strain ATCC MYA-4447 / BCRC 22081 / CBS 7064 / NBRC 10061 / NRRL Y-12695) TaxID=559304 RepID=G8YGJ0_PICSO|nr:Piso0_003661 [Millerozyma farinosa CBS 7064]CCE81307.1 Piso0_003661 [Millerozyma farinosa CBS 7064]
MTSENSNTFGACPRCWAHEGWRKSFCVICGQEVLVSSPPGTGNRHRLTRLTRESNFPLVATRLVFDRKQVS